MDPITRLLFQGSAGAGEKIYIEDVFSTWLYTGNGSTQTITNGIDLSGKGGLVWTKSRSSVTNNNLIDTARGRENVFYSDTTLGNQVSGATQDLTSFNSAGFSLGTNFNTNINTSGTTYASWTFRKAEKFFDVVTWTGNYPTQYPRDISHNLGSTPGCVIIKRTSTTGNWGVWHRSISTGDYTANNTLYLNSTAAASNNGNVAGPFTSTTFRVGEDLNQNGETYVAYLFAHDAGGFGDSGNESVVKCGSYTGNSSTNFIDIGWEPQWLLVKRTSGSADWVIIDNMRGAPESTVPFLRANTAEAENTASNTNAGLRLNATGFTWLQSGFDVNYTGETYIYIAIRRGPMKTPTDATTVFNAQQGVVGDGYAGSPELQGLSIGFPSDMVFGIRKNNSTNVISNGFLTNTRLTDKTFLYPWSTAAESSSFGGFASFGVTQNDIAIGDAGGINDSGYRGFFYNFRRAPGFFDVVAYTGTGVARTVSHNLGVAPELMIIKCRSTGYNWATYDAFNGATKYLAISTASESRVSSAYWNDTAPSASHFTVNTNSTVNTLSATYIAYLFASCPGVSKVGSYTGSGTTKDIDCGFTNGARFVLIKRTDSTGDWYLWDTARGIVSGNDPFLLLNSTVAEVTNTDYIDPLSSGFQISSTAPAAINASGGSFIYLAIA